MSPHVGNFVQDLVEMAKAMDELPKVQGELSDTRRELDAARGTIQDRELRIIDLKSQIESLQSSLRTTEASRDDAEFRFLEAEERTDKLEWSFQKALEAMDETDTLIQSFKPLPEPMPEPKAEAPTTSAIGASTESGANLADTGQSSGPEAWSEPQWYPIAPQGQSESNPTSASTSQEDMKSNPADLSNDTLVDGSAKQSASGRYSGCNYFDHPVYVPRDEWIAGGGTNENYDWLPIKGALTP